jgi:arylsulfatase A-like enzyme
MRTTTPVGHQDLAPTFCQIAGVSPPATMDGAPLPTSADDTRERIITTFDSQFAAVGMHLQTIYRDGWLCTRYQANHPGSAGRFRFFWSIWGRGSEVPIYDGTEGELYNLRDDPFQQRNLWGDPASASMRSDLLADLMDHLPPLRDPPLRTASPT